MTTATVAQIDIRGFEDPELSDVVLKAFDALAPGESLVVVGPLERSGLLRRLQVERKGLFEWSPLGNDEACHRTEVTRRSASRGALRGVTEALAWDHDRLDALEQRTFEFLAAGEVQGARLAWTDFAAGLKRHISFEEELLFPAFEARLGIPPNNGPTAVMRDEHREIEALIDAIGRALAGHGEPLPLRHQLHGLLGEHNVKEERVLYPRTDQMLEPAEADALVARIQAS